MDGFLALHAGQIYGILDSVVVLDKIEVVYETDVTGTRGIRLRQIFGG